MCLKPCVCGGIQSWVCKSSLYHVCFSIVQSHYRGCVCPHPAARVEMRLSYCIYSPTFSQMGIQFFFAFLKIASRYRVCGSALCSTPFCNVRRADQNGSFSLALNWSNQQPLLNTKACCFNRSLVLHLPQQEWSAAHNESTSTGNSCS